MLRISIFFQDKKTKIILVTLQRIELTILKGDFSAMAADASAAKEANDHGDSNTRMGSKEQFAIDGMEFIFEICFPNEFFGSDNSLFVMESRNGTAKCLKFTTVVLPRAPMAVCCCI